MPVTIDDIRAAAKRIAGAVELTPFVRSRTLSKLTGAEIFLKFENLQFTASFKERGALNKLLSLSEAERKRGVIAMSAGNHAQAVAYHAARLGIPAVIVMPKGSPNTKVRNTRVHGAEVVLEGDSLADAARHAFERAKQDNLVFVHPYEDPLVIAGQGTCGLEMLEAMPDLDALVVPVGGRGRGRRSARGSAGVAAALRRQARRPADLGRQHRQPPARLGADAGAGARRAPGQAARDDARRVGQPGESRGADRRGRRQHRRGAAPAHLRHLVGAQPRGRVPDRNPRPGTYRSAGSGAQGERRQGCHVVLR